MPITKHKYARFQVINECLQNTYKKWDWEALAEACEERLNTSVSRRTIFNDIEEMNQEYADFVEDARRELIEFSKVKKSFYYTVKGFNLNKSALKTTDYALLREMLDIFGQFKELPKIEGFEEIVMKLQQLFYIPQQESYVPIQFEKLPPQKGLEWLSILYEYVVKKQVIKIGYAPFKEPEHEAIIHPYLLKQYNQRWFLIAWNASVKRVYVYALDRIVRMEKLEGEVFYRDAGFDAERYYQDIIGVTLYTDKKAEKILLLFDKDRAKYVMTKPIHFSQKTIDESDKGVLIELCLIPNPELEAWILGFGKDVRVVEPAYLTEQVKDKLKRAWEGYC
jgi:predicted DNA-binding transcriptional regulator YafY